jgi:hypothetical protein
MDESVKKAARKILSVFRNQSLGARGFIHFDEFTKARAIIWDQGFIKHENQKEALIYLRTNGYVNESDAGLELTEKGASAVKKL